MGDSFAEDRDCAGGRQLATPSKTLFPGAMDRPARTIAITGATGFAGRRVVERLLQEPDIVLRCLVRPKSESR